MRAAMIAAAAALSALASAGAAGAQSPSGQDLTPDARGAYVTVAGANALYQVRAAELALEKARRPEVRQLAETELAEHRQAMAELETAARAGGLGELLPPGMMPMQWEMLRRLERVSGARFDTLYLEQQRQAHGIGQALHRNFAANGNSERLKALAAATLPMVDRHLERLRALNP